MKYRGAKTIDIASQVLFESKMKSLAYDIENMDNGNFVKKYGMSKERARDEHSLKDMNEAAEGSLSGESLVNNLTSICMSTWYTATKKFNSKPDQFDIQPNEGHDKYNVLKMTPGNDVISDVYETITSTTTKLASDLNSAFGKDIFEPRINRSSGNLETLVGFSNSSGGVFQCRADSNGGDTTVHLTMPTEEQLNIAFSAMTETPHANDGLDGEDFQDPEDIEVAGDPVPDYEEEPLDDAPEGQDINPSEFEDEGFRESYSKRKQAARIGDKISKLPKDKRSKKRKSVSKKFKGTATGEIIKSSSRVAEFKDFDRLKHLSNKGFRSIAERKELNNLSAQYRIWKRGMLEAKAHRLLSMINEAPEAEMFFGHDFNRMSKEDAQKLYDKHAGSKNRRDKRIRSKAGKILQRPRNDVNEASESFTIVLKNKDGEQSTATISAESESEAKREARTNYRGMTIVSISQNIEESAFKKWRSDVNGEKAAHSFRKSNRAKTKSTNLRRKFDSGEGSKHDFIDSLNQGDKSKKYAKKGKSFQDRRDRWAAELGEAEEYNVPKAKKPKTPPITIEPENEEDTVGLGDANILLNKVDLKKRKKVNEEELDEMSPSLKRSVKKRLKGDHGRQAHRIGKRIGDLHLSARQAEDEINDEEETEWTDHKRDVVTSFKQNNIKRGQRVSGALDNKPKLLKKFEKGMKRSADVWNEAVDGDNKGSQASAYNEAKEAEAELYSLSSDFSKLDVSSRISDKVVLTVKAKKDSCSVDAKATWNESKDCWKIRFTKKVEDDKKIMNVEAASGELLSKMQSAMNKLKEDAKKEEPEEVDEEMAANSVGAGGVDLAVDAVETGRKSFVTLRKRGFAQGPF